MTHVTVPSHLKAAPKESNPKTIEKTKKSKYLQLEDLSEEDEEKEDVQILIPSFKNKMNYRKSEKLLIESRSKLNSSTKNFIGKGPTYEDINFDRQMGGKLHFNYSSLQNLNKQSKLTAAGLPLNNINKLSFKGAVSLSQPYSSPKYKTTHSSDPKSPSKKKQTLISL